LKQVVHVSDDKCNVEEREKVGYVLNRKNLVQKRLVCFTVRPIVFKICQLLSHYFGYSTARITTAYWLRLSCEKHGWSVFVLALHRHYKTAEEASCDHSGLDFVAGETGKSLHVSLLRNMSD
jgi:hypothetical protein